MTRVEHIRVNGNEYVLWHDGCGYAEVWKVPAGNPPPDRVVSKKERADVSPTLTRAEIEREKERQ